MSDEEDQTEGAAEADAAEASATEGFGTDAAAEVAGRLAETLGPDLGSLLGVAVEASTGDPEIGAPGALSWPGPLVVEPLRIGELTGLLACPTADAALLGALQGGGDLEAAKAARESGALGEYAEAFGDVRKLVTAMLGRCFEGHADGELESEEAKLIADPAQGGFPNDAPHVRVEIPLAIEGSGASPLYLLIASTGAPAGLANQALVVIDADGDERDRMEELGEEQDREITAIDPGDLDEDAYESISEAGGVLVCWDLGGRSGLELAEQLAQDPRSKAIPVLLAHSRVNRAMVEAALRAGAAGFVLLPYDLAEIDRLLAG